MKNCPKCGASGDDSMKFCPICGSPLTETAPSAPAAPTPPPMTPPVAPSASNGAAAGTEPPKSSVSDVINGINNTADTTSEYDPADIKNNTVMGVLAYLGLLVFIPMFAAKESKFAQFHANQGLLLLILWIASGVISWLGKIPVIGFLFAGFNIIGTGYLSASEHAKEAFTASVCRGFVAIAVCSVILSRIFGIRGVWLSFMAAEALTAGITAWALLKDRKKEAMA